MGANAETAVAKKEEMAIEARKRTMEEERWEVIIIIFFVLAVDY